MISLLIFRNNKKAQFEGDSVKLFTVLSISQFEKMHNASLMGINESEKKFEGKLTSLHQPTSTIMTSDYVFALSTLLPISLRQRLCCLCVK